MSKEVLWTKNLLQLCKLWEVVEVEPTYELSIDLVIAYFNSEELSRQGFTDLLIVIGVIVLIQAPNQLNQQSPAFPIPLCMMI